MNTSKFTYRGKDKAFAKRMGYAAGGDITSHWQPETRGEMDQDLDLPEKRYGEGAGKEIKPSEDNQKDPLVVSPGSLDAPAATTRPERDS